MRSSLRVLATTVVVVLVGVCAAGPVLAYGGGGYQPPVVALSTTAVLPGGSLSVQGAFFTPTGSVELSLHSAPVFLARVQADADGAFAAVVTIPSGTPAGAHTLEALDIPTGSIATAALTVEELPVETPPPPLAGTGVAVALLLAVGLVLVAAGGLTLRGARKPVRRD